MSFRNLDLNLLKVFDAVMAERSMTRAAERLSMTQPAVSHALKRLREALGEDLFVRQAFGMKPTSRAEGLWPEVRSALTRLRVALDPGDYQPTSEEYTFRLAMADATAALILPPLMQQLERMRALANVHVLPLTTRDPRQLLEQGEADFALGYFPNAVAALKGQGDMAAIRQQRLYDSYYVCVMRRAHPLADQELTLDAFCQAHHLLVSFSGRPYGFVDEALAALKRSRRIALTVNQFFTAGRVVAHSDLLTVLPQSFITATGYQDALIYRPLPMPLSPVHVDVLWHLRNEDRSAQRWMRERLIDAVRPPTADALASTPADVSGDNRAPMSIAHDLSDAEFDELDELLAITPEPLEPLDASMLDGYLAGVLVQPRLIPIEEWLPPIFDYEGRALPDDVDPDWLARIRALVERRFASLNHSMLEQGWFYPVVLDLEADDADADGTAEDAAEGAAPEAAAPAEAKADEPVDPDAPQLPDDPITQSLLPWVGGFEYAAVTFPDLHEQADDNINALLARLYRHLPAETPEEVEIVELLNQEHPLKNLDEAIEDLILTVVDLQEATEQQRYHVEQVRRDAPKLGRNDPCHCGSGKKFKNCHGAA